MATNKVNVVFDADSRGFHKTVTGVGSALSGLKAKVATAFGTLGISMIANSIMEFADGIKTMADQLNVGTDAAQRFDKWMKNASVSTNATAATLDKLDTAMRKWKGGTLDAKEVDMMKKLGFTDKDFDMQTEAMFKKFAEKAKSLDFETIKFSLEGIGVNEKASREIAGGIKDFDPNSKVVDEKTLKNLEEFGELIGDVARIVKTELAPVLSTLADKARDLAIPIVALIDKFGRLAKKVAPDEDNQIAKIMDHVSMIQNPVRGIGKKIGLVKSGLDLADEMTTKQELLHKWQKEFRKQSGRSGPDVADTRFHGYLADNKTSAAFGYFGMKGPEAQYMPVLSKPDNKQALTRMGFDLEKDKKELVAIAYTFGQLYGPKAVAKFLIPSLEEAKKNMSQPGAIHQALLDSKAASDRRKDEANAPKPKFVRQAITDDEEKRKKQEERDRKEALMGRTPQVGGIETSQFMSIGGLAGADLQYRITRLAEESNRLLARIATAVEALNTKPNTQASAQPWPT
jgi:hypothetical protein